MKLLIDSTPLIGLLLKNDQWHEASLKLGPLIDNHQTYITDIILAETINSLKGTNGKMGKLIFEKLIKTNKIIIIKTMATYESAIDIFLKYDGSIGFSDCTTIQIMSEKNINHILSFDSDFDKVENVIRIHEKNFFNYL